MVIHHLESTPVVGHWQKEASLGPQVRLSLNKTRGVSLDKSALWLYLNAQHQKLAYKMKDRRSVLKFTGLSASGLLLAPKDWTKPIVNSVMLPAHAQTSANCSSFTTTQVSESISLSVTATQVSGQITASRTGNTFSGTESSVLGSCQGSQQLNLEVRLTGVINAVNNSLEGELVIIQRCGLDLVSEQTTTFTAQQSPASNSIEGTYTGTLIGNLRSCDDF